MKNSFVFAHLILGVTFVSALLAELGGILPSSVVSLPTFIGLYVIAGVLAMAFEDYGRSTSRDAQHVADRAPQTEKRAAPVPAARPRPARVHAPSGASPEKSWGVVWVNPAAPRTRV
jgi:hypothetical protein